MAPPSPDRRRVLTLDLDGTLIQGTVFQALADAVGKGEEVRRLDALYESGAMSLEENFAREHALFVGLAVAEAQEAVRRGPWLRDIPEGVARLRGLGLRVGLLTDQPCFLASLAEPTLDPLLCSPGGVEDGAISARVELRADKAAHLRAWCGREGVGLEQVIHCGNGTNDVPVFQRVGLAVAVNPSGPEVERAADVTLDGVTSLREVAMAVERALRG